MLSSAARDAMMNATSLSFLSLHSGFPGTTGLNEIAATRAAIPWTTAVGGHMRRGTQISITVPTAVALSWVGGWSALTGGVFQGKAPLGGHPLEFHVTPATNRVVIPGGHTWIDAQAIVFYGDTPPPPLVEGTTYYVRDALPDQLRVASNPGGSAIALTGPAGVQCVVAKIRPLTIGTSALVRIPKIFLRFVRNTDPVWSGSTSITILPGETFDLKTLVSDVNGDTLAFSLDTLSPPLPTGVTLASSGILTCAPSSAPANLSGILFVADDQVGD